MRNDSFNLFSSRSHLIRNVLDWDILAQKILVLTHFNEEKQKILLPEFILNRKELDFQFEKIHHFLESDDLEAIKQKIGQIPQLDSVQVLLQRTEKGSVLELSEINLFVCIYEGLSNLKEYFYLLSRDLYDDSFKKSEQFLKVKLQQPIRVFVTSNGKVFPEKNPILFPFYEKLHKLEIEIRQKIEKIKTRPEIANALQFKEHDIWDDKFVLAIRSDSYQSSFGRIIGHSSTGQTLYIEPFSISSLREKRQLVQNDLDAAFFKIRKDFSEKISSLADFFEQIFNILLLMDRYSARALFASKYKLSRPYFSKTFKIEGFLHLLLASPVKNSIHLAPEQKGLLISGPNTGGKTVAIKSIALIFLLSHMGIFVPAESAEIPFIEQLYFFSHDPQSLSDGLSSFSSEVKQYLETSVHASDKALYFFDEIFNSTSSQEASLLAYSLFKKLSEHGAHVFATTHHEDLKRILLHKKEFICASVSLDSVTEKPTYSLAVGQVGQSHALTIFRQLEKAILDSNEMSLTAFSALDENANQAIVDLNEIDRLRMKLKQSIQENEHLKASYIQQKKSFKSALELQFEEKYKALEQQYHKASQKILAEFERFKQGDIGKKTFESELRNQRHSLKSNIPKTAQQMPGFEIHEIQKLKLQEEVYSKKTKANMIVDRIDPLKEKIYLKKGSLGLWHSLKDIRILKGRPPQEIPKTTFVDFSESSSIEIDCRGMKLDDFMDAVYKKIGHLNLEKIPYLNIIHGHGNGILKNWLRNEFKNSPDYSMELDPHNDGQTTLKLKV